MSIDVPDSLIYAVSPECGARRCTVTKRRDILTMRFIYQHGDNPEAVCFVDAIPALPAPWLEAQRVFREFAERCHRYDDEGAAS